MSNTCPKCGAELRADAKFCDQCGTPVNGASQAPAVAVTGAPAKINWTALIVIVAVIAVMGWLLFGQDKATDDTHVVSGSANSHGGMDTVGSAHGETGTDMGMGGSPHGGMDGMDSGMPDLDALKARLDNDPLDAEALFTLYQTYGMIGRGSQVRPYLEAAIAEAEAQQDELGDELEATITNIAMAALVFGNDLEGARIAAEKALELIPESIPPLKTMGDVYYWQDMPAESIEWYARYFDAVAPENRKAEYWYALANNAEMLLLTADESDDGSLAEQAVADLTMVTEQLPEHFPSWFNLGQGMLELGDEAEAERLWEQARGLALNEHDKWMVDAALAELHGEEPPPEPTRFSGMGESPMTNGGAGMANPHGA